MFWTIYIIVNIIGQTEPVYIGVESFETRAICESRLMSRQITVDDLYKFDFKCLKTDSEIRK